ncbi:hypothetical protein [Agaribacter flavus]|uniref:Uncharacterized protein n=1 Tax=Agaribacter flavus TaxID=1902781 RepID=A0ABV7FRK0_9ALTE
MYQVNFCDEALHKAIEPVDKVFAPDNESSCAYCGEAAFIQCESVLTKNVLTANTIAAQLNITVENRRFKEYLPEFISLLSIKALASVLAF